MNLDINIFSIKFQGSFPLKCILNFAVECSKGFFLYSNKCLQAVSDRKSWNEARMNCKKLGGRLAVIRTQVDQNAVNDVDFGSKFLHVLKKISVLNFV